MKIGVSLPFDYLAGGHNPIWSAEMGSVSQCLKTLKDYGVDSVELRAINGNTDISLLLTALDTVFTNGMEATIHGTLPPFSEDIIIDSPYATACKKLKEYGQDAIITVHGYRSDELANETLAERTALATDALLTMAEQEDLPLKLALELNREKHGNDPGRNWHGLLDLHALTKRKELGFCWDFGHSISNILRGYMNHSPPAAFLERVIHTHIHGTNQEGQTHWPIRHDCDSTRRWMEMLAEVNYTGILNLELEPERFIKYVRLREGLTESLGYLKDCRF
ncbi:MAG: sugar phosphate isomerase/epimerase [Lentisphaerae bacterium]|nr:sugar phosphate isomerase/epimerase [Lentisphaerota bacterium]